MRKTGVNPRVPVVAVKLAAVRMPGRKNSASRLPKHGTFPRLFLASVLLTMVVTNGCRQHSDARQPGSASLLSGHPSGAQRTLRVCADPNNLPYSNQQQQGFENDIASLVAHDLGARVAYTWWPQRRGFVRMTLKRDQCDVIMGVPSNFELALPTAPYYRSSYVFVSRSDRHLGIRSLDDPKLRTLKIGVQMIGNDHVNSPPAHALANRGIVRNVKGFTVYGDYRNQEPGREIIDAVAKGDVDLAIVWGPQAGFFARQESVPLAITPVSPQIDLPFLPFVFDISMGVRRGDVALREQLDHEIERRHDDIDRILDRYGVPRV